MSIHEITEMSWVQRFLKAFKSIAHILVYLFVFYLLAVFCIQVLKNTIDGAVLVHTINHYLQTLLVSWPAAVLILGLFLLITQRQSIADFISKRMTSVGLDGVKGGISQEDASALLSKQQINEPAEENSQDLPVTSSVVPVPSDSTPLPVVVSESDTIVQQNKELLEQLGFEKIYNVIFGTQITILTNLRQNVTGLNLKVIAAVYEQWRKDDEILKNYPLSDYLNFLQSNGLVYFTEVDAERTYYIQTKGIDFLNYIEINKYPYKQH